MKIHRPFIFITLFILNSCVQVRNFDYNIAIIGKIDTKMDPVLKTEVNSRTLLNQLCGRLVKINENLELEPFLAKSWTISNDGLSYTFDLYDNLFFLNKKSVTALDVKFSLERMRTTKDSYASSLTRNIKDIDVISSYRLKLTLITPNVKFLYLLAHPRFCILSSNQPFIEIDGILFPNSVSNISVYSWNEKTETLKLIDSKNKATINLFYLTQQEAINKFNKKELDDLSFYLLTDNEIDSITAPKTIVETNYYWTWVFDFNLSSKNSKKLSFRRNIYENFDRDEFVHDWNTSVTPAKSLIPKGFLAKFDLDFKKVKYPHLKSPQKCISPVSIGVIDGIPSQESFEIAAKKQFKALTGCVPKIIWIPMSEFSKVSSERQYDIYFSAISNRLIDPIEYFRSYIDGNSENLLGCSFSKLNTAFHILEKTQVYKRTLNSYSNLERIFRESACAVPIGNPRFKFIYSNKFEKIYNNPIGMDLNFWTSNIPSERNK